MSRDRFEPVTRQLASRDVVAAHGVERVDQLTTGNDEALAALGISLVHRSAPCGAAAQAGGTDAADGQRNAKSLRAPVQEWEVESVQVVILDHVRIDHANHVDQPANEVGLAGVGVVSRLENARTAVRLANRDHEDAVPARIEPRGFQIELKPLDLIE